MVDGRHDALTCESTFLLNEPDVVIEAFPDETIAVNLGTGRYYSIDLVGAEILGLLTSGHELGTIVKYLADRYGIEILTVDSAVTDFALRLLAEGLIATGPSTAPAELPPPGPAAAPFSVPDLSVYSDMEDLLLLDPIHDVDSTGWPVRADTADAEAGPHSPP
jgi:hypothetical protein